MELEIYTVIYCLTKMFIIFPWEDYKVGGKTMKDRLNDYMEANFPGVEIKLVDTLDNNIKVYQFSY